jgi:hypothetical protein
MNEEHAEQTAVTVVLLAGGIEHSLLRKQVGHAIGTLPISAKQSLLGCWLERIAAEPRVRKVIVATSEVFDQADLRHAVSSAATKLAVDVVIDPDVHRGTAGVVADVLWHDDSTIMCVGEVSAVPPPSIGRAIDALGQERTLMVVGTCDDARAIGFFAFHRKALGLVPRVGYFDLKEQFINAVIKDGHIVRAVQLMDRHLRLTTLEGWLEATKHFDGGIHQAATVSDQARLEGSVCIEEGARVGSASLCDAIIMRGAVVEDGAIIARSVVGPGARVAQGRRVIDGIFLDARAPQLGQSL